MVYLNIHSDENTLQISREYDSPRTYHTIEIDPLFKTIHAEYDHVRERCLTAGGAPFDGELSIIKAARDVMDQDRHKHLNQIKQLEASLIEAIHKMRQSETQIKLCDSLLAPIRRLPSDTLREIFSWCIRTSEGVDINKTPLRIRRVCRYWHDLITADRLNGTRLRIDIPSGPKPTSANYVDMVSQALSMYRPAPRSSVPFSLAYFSSGYGAESRKILPLLVPHLSLCKHLYLGSDTFMEAERIIYVSQWVPPVFVNLERLYMNFTQLYPTGIWPRLLSNVPKLVEIQMVMWASDNFLLLLGRPEQIGQQLRRLSTIIHVMDRNSLGTPPITSWRNLVKKFPYVDTLEVQIGNYMRRRLRLPSMFIEDLDYPNLQSSPFPLQNLLRLTISSDFAGYLTSFVEGFSFPNISYLSLDVFHPFRLVDEEMSYQKSMTNELSFFANLIELRLIRVCIAEDDLRVVLETTTRLERLTIMNLNPHTQWYTYGPCLINNDPVLSLLTVHHSDDPDPLVPNLERLHLFHNVVANSTKPQSDVAEQYTSLFDSRSQWRNQRSLIPRFSLHITISSYRKQGSKTQVECEVPEREFEEFKAAVYHYASSGRAYKRHAGSLVVVEKAREPFQKIQQSRWRNGENPESRWKNSIDTCFPELL